MNLSNHVRSLFGVVALAATAPPAIAQKGVAVDFPDRPVKLIVPFSPGGGSDIAGRLLQRAVTDTGSLSQPLVIVNVPGGGGTIGSRRVKDSPADGHTLLLLHEGIFTARHSGQATYGAEVFEPVAAFGRTGTILVVAKGSPYQTLEDLVSHCRKNPDDVSFACNLGAPAHFIGLQFQKAAGGIQLRFVPSGGGSKRYKDLDGGQVVATIFSISEFSNYQGGSIRPLALFASERHPEFPEIPTAKEQGVPLETENMQFVWAPAGTPGPIVSKIADAIRNALGDPEVTAEFSKIHLDPTVISGGDLVAEIASQEAAISSVATSTPEIFPWFPHAVALLCAGLVLFIAFDRVKGRPPPTPDASESPDAVSPISQMAFAATTLVYVLCLAAGVPFVPATIAFAFLTCCFLMGFGRVNFPKFAAIAAFSIGIGFGCYFVFDRVLSIDLP